MEKIEFEPIGFFHCSQSGPTDSPRQAVLAEQHRGFVELKKEIAVDALRDLEGFSHIWLIYNFHNNKTWTPTVRPPRGEKRRGVFATRAPYRPNPVGMSCVEIEKVEGRKVFVKAHDLLDQTPVLDIKPYLVYADSQPQASLGWLEGIKAFDVEVTEELRPKLQEISQELGISLEQILTNQLAYEPTNNKIKRVKRTGDHFEFAYKTWRFLFQVETSKVRISAVRSVSQSET